MATDIPQEDSKDVRESGSFLSESLCSVSWVTDLTLSFFRLLLTLKKSAMDCANIIIITKDGLEKDDEEAQVRDWLKDEVYSGRSVTVFECKMTNEFVKVSGTGIPVSGTGSTPNATGIYVIGHGFTTGFHRPLNTPAAAEAFAKTLLSWVEQKFRIRKLCMIICCGIAKQSRKTPQPVPAPGQSPTGTQIFVQQICQAISIKDTNRKLDGLMVAGYSKGVYATKDLENPDNPTIRTKESGYYHRPMRPKLKDASVDWKKELKSYATNKLVFVWNNGEWKLGKLSDYTDNADYKAKLQQYSH